MHSGTGGRVEVGDRFMVLCTFCGGVLCISAIGFFAYYASIVRACEWRISIEHYSCIVFFSEKMKIEIFYKENDNKN